MKNKVLAIFGILSYILSVVATATDLEGNYKMPIGLNIIAVILMTIFVIMAVIRLWKKAKVVSILLLLTTIIVNILYLPILWFNITKIISLITYIWTIILLWVMPRNKETNNEDIVEQTK